jgi:hypothetical protein
MRSRRLLASVGALLLGVLGVGAGVSGTAAGARPAPAAVAAKHAVPHWSAVTTVNAQPHYTGNAVSCPTPSFCMAVGAIVGLVGAEGVGQGNAETWNGHSWSVVKPPSDPGGNVILNGVSCVSASFCVAVGEDQNATTGTGTSVADVWDGQLWTSEPTTAFPGHATLLGVSCTSTTFCMAVGDSNDNAQCLDGGGSDSGQDTLAERWDGHAWLVVDTPSFGQCGTQGGGRNGYYDILSAVSCTSGTSCVSVGGFVNAPGVAPDGEQTAAATWSGTTWSAHPALDPNASDDLTAVSCTAATTCLAVGSTTTSQSQSQSLAQEWNGSTWTDVPTPQVATPGVFNGVSCTGPAACVAVGTDGLTSNPTLIETWTGGGAWSRSAAPAVYQPDGVSCPAAAHCTVVGDSLTAFSQSPSVVSAVVLMSHGATYQRTFLPVSTVEPNRLVSESCVGKTCFAVGSLSEADVVPEPLIETGGASGWRGSRAAAPGLHDSADVLAGVSCVTARRCMAVGSLVFLDRLFPLTAQWNGRSWTGLPSPVDIYPSALSAVSCSGSRFCMAVGHRPGPATGTTAALTEVWNGATWTVNKAPGPGKEANSLDAVSCVTPTRCFAVGQQSATATGPARVLTERWNGHRWSVIKARNPGSKVNDLTGISCPSRHGCVAVGYEASGSRRHTLIETLHSGRWTVAKSRNVAHTSSVLNAVSCLSLTRCDAVGDSGKAVTRTLAEALAGSKWAITKSANHGTKSNALLGVSCDTSLCSAVGARDARVAQTLVEVLSG